MTPEANVGHMHLALAEARSAAERGEVPVGAVIVSPSGRVVARAGNRTRELNDPTARAEILAIRAACQAAGTERLTGHDLYVTSRAPPHVCRSGLVRAHRSALIMARLTPRAAAWSTGPASSAMRRATTGRSSIQA